MQKRWRLKRYTGHYTTNSFSQSHRFGTLSHSPLSPSLSTAGAPTGEWMATSSWLGTSTINVELQPTPPTQLCRTNTLTACSGISIEHCQYYHIATHTYYFVYDMYKYESKYLLRWTECEYKLYWKYTTGQRSINWCTKTRLFCPEQESFEGRLGSRNGLM